MELLVTMCVANPKSRSVQHIIDLKLTIFSFSPCMGFLSEDWQIARFGDLGSVARLKKARP